MGQKTISNSLHLLKNKNWNAFWYADYNIFKFSFQEDINIYLFIRSISKIRYDVLKKRYLFEIEVINCFIYKINKIVILNLELTYLKKNNLNKKKVEYFIKSLLIKLKKKNVNELLISYIVGKSTALFIALKIGKLLEKRIRFQSKIVDTLIKQVNCFGIYIICKGRINYVDRAKKEKIFFGSVPLSTISANIDYGLIIANTKKGLQSIKIWVFKKDL
jgi:small subunit ribosomal protein S3